MKNETDEDLKDKAMLAGSFFGTAFLTAAMGAGIYSLLAGTFALYCQLAFIARRIQKARLSERTAS